MKGRIKAGAGAMADNPDLEARGQAEKAGGKLQKKAGDIQQVFED